MVFVVIEGYWGEIDVVGELDECGVVVVDS